MVVIQFFFRNTVEAHNIQGFKNLMALNVLFPPIEGLHQTFSAEGPTRP